MSRSTSFAEEVVELPRPWSSRHHPILLLACPAARGFTLPSEERGNSQLVDASDTCILYRERPQFRPGIPYYIGSRKSLSSEECAYASSTFPRAEVLFRLPSRASAQTIQNTTRENTNLSGACTDRSKHMKQTTREPSTTPNNLKHK